MVNESYYKLLEIEPGASPEEVKRSYYALAKKNHPDLFPEKERHVKEHAMMK
ncbi:MAG: DnaJ domain-containing protein, partial [bacterium]|nr:DnaJ domain-containing protein [bacterium]